MGQGNRTLWFSRTAVVATSLLAASGFALAQNKTAVVPDAQIEANVLKALASAPGLADQSISTTTVYGTVTLSGTVRDEASRSQAEQLVANSAGVKKVVDELVIGAIPAQTTGVSQPPMDQASGDQGSNPNLQSDGTIAPAPGNQAQDNGMPQQEQPAPQDQGQAAPYGQPGPYGQPPYPQNQGQQAGQQPPYPPPTYRQPYGQQQPAYAQQQRPPQQAGQTVVVPNGTILRVRLNQAFDSKNTQPGTAFDGVVLNDVIAGGAVAIPRGASVQGVVTDVQTATPLRGRGGLALQLTQVVLEGKTYPLSTNEWEQAGADKTGNTVGNTVGLGAVGALIGAAAGGGPGALLGAGIGSIAGLGVSSAGNGNARMPAEAIVSFQLTQQAALTTVSQAELDRLGAGLPPPNQQLRPRYPAPPPPYYYGPGGYYAYPYPYYGYYRYYR